MTTMATSRPKEQADAAGPRVCLLTETFYPVIGGGESQAKALAESLAANGFGVVIITRRSDASFRKSEQFGVVTVYRLPPVGTQHLKKWGLLFSSLPALVRMRRQYDLVLVSGFRVLGISAVVAGKLLKRPVVLKADSLGEMSGDFFAGGLVKLGLRPSSLAVRLFLWARNSLLRRADCFVSISPAVTAELVDQGVDAHKIREIPNGVDMARFHPIDAAEQGPLREVLHLPETDTIVIYTGRLVSYKGLPLLLEVWCRIKAQHKQAHLVLVGSGGLDIHNCEAELREYARRHNLQDSVHFTGAVQNVHQYLQAADIFVFPTEQEAFGISLVEAMACGLAVISTSTGGTRELVAHGENGLAIEVGDFQQLYDTLNTLISDRPLATRLGKRARQAIKERMALEQVTRQYMDLFRCVTSAPNRRLPKSDAQHDRDQQFECVADVSRRESGN